MKQADLKDLKVRVARVVGESDLATDVQDVDVEVGADEFGDQFLRVILKVALKTSRPGQYGWKRIASLVREIEDEVAELDDRFPSVRLAEAA